MNYRKTSKKPVALIKKYLVLTINASTEVKDEAYTQILKQIHENPNENS